MRTSFTVLLASAAAALMMAMPAQAEDYRVLATFSGNTGEQFCREWKCACVNYTPKDTSLYFEGTYCQPGDFHGQNTNTEATVYCEFTNGTTKKAVNRHVAAQVGATIS